MEKNIMNEFLVKELKRAQKEGKLGEVTIENIKKWIRQKKTKQIAFLFLESVVLLGIGAGNLFNSPPKSFPFALGLFCIVFWFFLAFKINQYLNKIESKDEDLEEILRHLTENID